MKRLFTFVALACAIIATSSCVFVRINKDGFVAGTGERVVASKTLATTSYTVPQFTGIESTISADIDYRMSDGEPSVWIEAPDNFIDHMHFGVEDGILKVCFDDNRNYKFSKIKIKVSSATLESLSIFGAGDFDARDLVCSGMEVSINGAGDVTFDGITCDGDMSVSVRGAGDIDVDGLSCQGLKVEIMGAGDVSLSGKAEYAELRIMGAGDIDASRLDCSDIRPTVAGVGSIRRK